MRTYREHLILKGSTIKQALAKLNVLGSDAILFVVDTNDKLIGSLTDGDVRRALLKDIMLDHNVEDIVQSSPRFIRKGNYSLEDIISYRKENFRIIPVLDYNDIVINVLNFRLSKSYLPVDAVIMAGGRGSRLKPLTDSTPKPLLKVGDKSIIEHNLDRLKLFGVDDFWLSVRYLGEQIEEHFKGRYPDDIKIECVWEDKPLGTLGAVSLINNLRHDYVLITNSDILTTMDYESFFMDFIKKDADMSVVTIPYDVSIPYAVMETDNGTVTSFKEKPTYTYYSNAGIYLVKREILNRVPVDTFYNSTDLMENLINTGGKLLSYPIREYWLDIGKHEDFAKAQKDIKNLKL